MTSPNTTPSYEKSKIDGAKLREAVQKIFAYGPSASRKTSDVPPAAKHRKRAEKGSK